MKLAEKQQEVLPPSQRQVEIDGEDAGWVFRMRTTDGKILKIGDILYIITPDFKIEEHIIRGRTMSECMEGFSEELWFYDKDMADAHLKLMIEREEAWKKAEEEGGAILDEIELCLVPEYPGSGNFKACHNFFKLDDDPMMKSATIFTEDDGIISKGDYYHRVNMDTMMIEFSGVLDCYPHDLEFKKSDKFFMKLDAAQECIYKGKVILSRYTKDTILYLNHYTGNVLLMQGNDRIEFQPEMLMDAMSELLKYTNFKNENKTIINRVER